MSREYWKIVLWHRSCSGAAEMNQNHVLAGKRFAQAHNAATGGYPLVVMKEEFRVIRGPLASPGSDKGPVRAPVSEYQPASAASQDCMNS